MDIDNIPKRTLRVRGIADPGSIIKVHVDSVLCKNGCVTDENLFEFQTLVSFHGALPITITVAKGKVTLGDSIVTYPAVFNNNATGYFSFKVPLEDLLCDNNYRQYKNYSITLNEGDTFSCCHLLVNGPSLWKIKINSTHVYEGMTVYSENVDLRVPLISTVSAEYCYPCFEPGHQHGSLEKLLQRLISCQ